MIAIAHFLLGALIGKSFESLLLISILAFISHFILDAIPHYGHGHFKHRKEDLSARDWGFIVLDVLAGFLLALYFAFQFQFWQIAFGAFFAILPDLISYSAWRFKLLRKPFFKQFHTLHNKIHSFHGEIGFKLAPELRWLGVLFEAVVITATLALILFT